MKNMKVRKFLAALMAGTLAVGLVGCGGGSSESAGANGDDKTITIWATGSDNVRQIYETLVKDFNENSDYAGEYTAELQFMLSGTGTQTLPDMLASAYKAKQKNTDYDLVDLSGDDLSKIVSLIGEEALVKLDNSKIPNAERVSAESTVATDYVQPYRGTTVVLAYDSEKVKNPPTTVEELTQWIKDNPGRFAYNAPGTGGAGDSFARTSVYNYLPSEAITSDDEKWEQEWDKGFDYMKDIHKSMYQSGGSVVYPNKNQGTLDLLNQGEIDMCPNWADLVLSQRAKGTLKDTIKITQIDPAFTGSLQSLAIPTFGSNEDGAYAFIDYMLTDQAQEIMVQQMAAIPLVDTTNMNMTGFEDIQNMDVSKFRIMSIGDLSIDFNQRWDSEIATLK